MENEIIVQDSKAQKHDCYQVPSWTVNKLYHEHHCASINLLRIIKRVLILYGRGKWDKILLEHSVWLSLGLNFSTVFLKTNMYEATVSKNALTPTCSCKYQQS